MGGGVGEGVAGGNFGLGAPARELSQQTEPLEQVVGCETKIDGRSQKAAMMFSRQKPGQRGTCCGAACGGGGAVGAGAFNVFSANEIICERKSPPPPPPCEDAGGGDGGVTGRAGFVAGLAAIFVAGLLDDGDLAGGAGASEAVPVTQQLPSPGQKASESMSSQNMAKMPFMHSPSHSFNSCP